MSDEALRAETLDAIEARHADELAAVRAVTAGMTAKRDKTAVLKMEGAVTDRHYEEMRRWEQLAGVGSEEDEEGEEEEDPPANDDRDDELLVRERGTARPRTLPGKDVRRQSNPVRHAQQGARALAIAPPPSIAPRRSSRAARRDARRRLPRLSIK